jgi:high mobility group protein B3
VSAYIYFATEFGEKTRKSHPEMKITEVSVLAGKKWAEMSDAQKKPYISKNLEDKVRQEKQQASLDKRGYFVLEDGSKSTDEKNLPTRRARKASKSLPSDAEEAVRKPMKKAAAKK